MTEKWVNINGFIGLYQVSNFGRVKSLAIKYTKRPQGRQKDFDRILMPMDSGKGYKYVSLHCDGRRKNKHIHRLVAEHFLVNTFSKDQVNHKDGNKANNHVDNLEWVTLKENMIHASENGLLKMGESSHMAKIKEKDIIEIRELNKSGVCRNSLSDTYSLSKATIHRIIHKQSWKHI